MIMTRYSVNVQRKDKVSRDLALISKEFNIGS